MLRSAISDAALGTSFIALLLAPTLKILSGIYDSLPLLVLALAVLIAAPVLAVTAVIMGERPEKPEVMGMESGAKPRYIAEPFVYLETADRRLYAEPYWRRSKAVGKVFCLEPIQGGEHTEVKVSYAESIEPWVFDRRIGDEMLVRVEREEVADGKRHLRARIISTRDGSGRRDSGRELRIVLFE